VRRHTYWPVTDYLRDNPDPAARLCHCGCGHYVDPDESGTTRYHFNEECAARCLAIIATTTSARKRAEEKEAKLCVLSRAYPLPQKSWQSDAAYAAYTRRWEAERLGSHDLLGVTPKPGTLYGGSGEAFSRIGTAQNPATPRGGFRNGRRLSVSLPGRPATHRSDSDRQRAYRARVKTARAARSRVELIEIYALGNLLTSSSA
jgi:hypothetical protein